ncbi:methyltransferase domain-containing protein [Ectothiorhodospiraceae bacterium 2226]|nr:methyltransferase domain-containing protein [Ectothiorhodospiraceae bacterium 2226]
MGLQRSYTLFAPLYDMLVDAPTRGARADSLARLRVGAGSRVLLVGVGTGLDLPLLAPGPDYVGVDLTRAMLRRAERRRERDVALVQGDAMALPVARWSFQAAVLHLILAVVPDPVRALREAARAVVPGGQLLVLDKFLRRGQRAPVRRALSPLLGRIATRTDVVLEDLLEQVPELRVRHDAPALAGGWFRLLELEVRAVEPR